MDFKYYNSLTKKQELLLKGLSPLNWLLDSLKMQIEIAPKGDSNNRISLEQRINLFHLINDVIANGVEGSFAEFGCHAGNSATQIQEILNQGKSSKEFHVFDKFDARWEIKQQLITNFEVSNLPLPIIHEGRFSDTIPDELPSKLAFVHIDAGYGGDQVQLMDLIIFLLESIYERMSPGAICVLRDYHDTTKTVKGTNSNPGVKAACDIFFEDKPEGIYVLYGNRYSHGYFRKNNQKLNYN